MSLLPRSPVLAAWGAGVDSTAMLIELIARGEPVDQVLFADVGAEKAETLAFVPMFRAWLSDHGVPSEVVRYQPKNFKNWPPYRTLTENLLTNGTLPGIAFGRGTCSQKWKAAPQHAWAKAWPPAQAAWAAGRQVVKLIGYDAGPADDRRFRVAQAIDDPLYEHRYPLREWGWTRPDSIARIRRAGLPVPVKSACFFCTAARPAEVRSLPADQLRQIVLIEARARPRLRAVEGLWRQAVKGARGAEPRPGSMTAYIRQEGLLDAEEIEAIGEAAPRSLTRWQAAVAEAADRPEMRRWLTVFDAFAGKVAGLDAAPGLYDGLEDRRCRAYDRVVVAFSGGKDSLAALLHLLDLGVSPEVIELHHHLVDGRGPVLMDWPITPAYVAALADHFGLALFQSWREGGFRREMDRDGVPTAPILFDQPGAPLGRAGGAGPPGVRGRFPQVSADLSVRWCSPALKIDVLAAALRGQARFEDGRTLVVTGERAEESPARARYRSFEPHRTDCGRRRVDHWRPVLDWTETRVWERIAAAMIRPHPAYSLGWSRLSCRACIFGSPSQWATIHAIYPAIFGEIAARETRSGRTIQRAASVVALADRGVPYPAALAQPELAALAAGDDWTLHVIARPWALPAGAFGEAAGPS